MQKSENVEIPVESILVMAHSPRYAHYIVNGDSDVHSMKYLKLHDYLRELVPAKATELEKAVSTFQNFLVIVEPPEVILLEPEVEIIDPRKVIRDQMKDYSGLTAKLRQERKAPSSFPSKDKAAGFLAGISKALSGKKIDRETLISQAQKKISKR